MTPKQARQKKLRRIRKQTRQYHQTFDEAVRLVVYQICNRLGIPQVEADAELDRIGEPVKDHPEVEKWMKDWPPKADAFHVLRTVEHDDSVFVTMGVIEDSGESVEPNPAQIIAPVIEK